MEIDKSAQLNLSALLREQCKGQNNSLVIDSVMKTDIGGLIKAAKEDSVLRLDHFDPLSRTQKTE